MAEPELTEEEQAEEKRLQRIEDAVARGISKGVKALRDEDAEAERARAANAPKVTRKPVLGIF